MIITSILNGTNLNRDESFARLGTALIEPGVRKGKDNELEITTNQCDTGEAWVLATRDAVTPNETFLAQVKITSAETIDTSGDGYIIIRLSDAKVNDGTTNATDGSGIATIEKVASLPSKNYLTLATLTSGVITDARNFSTINDEVIDFNTVSRIVASQAQAEAGSDNATLMTPLRTAQYITSVSGAPNSATFTFAESIDGSTTPALCYLAISDTYDISQLVSNFAFGLGATPTWLAQTFLQQKALSISSVKFKLYKVGSPTGNAVVKIYATAAGVPTGSALATSSTIDISTLTTSTTGEIKTFTFSTPFAASASTTYAAILSVSGSLSDPANTIQMLYQSTNVYSGGNQVYSNNSGSTWTQNAPQDFVFEINYSTGPEIGKIYSSSGDYSIPLGYTNDNVSSGNTGIIAMQGVVDGFSGLTTGTYATPFTASGDDRKTLNISATKKLIF